MVGFGGNNIIIITDRRLIVDPRSAQNSQIRPFRACRKH
jgi:hypothetical protein